MEFIIIWAAGIGIACLIAKALNKEERRDREPVSIPVSCRFGVVRGLLPVPDGHH